MIRRLTVFVLLTSLLAVNSFKTTRDYRIGRDPGDDDYDIRGVQKTTMQEVHGQKEDENHQKHELAPQKILNRHKRIKKNIPEHHPDVNKILVEENQKNKRGKDLKNVKDGKPNARYAGNFNLMNTQKPVVKTHKNRNFKKESFKKDITKKGSKTGVKYHSKPDRNKLINSDPHIRKISVKGKGDSTVKKSKRKRSLDDKFDDLEGFKKQKFLQKYKNYKKGYGRHKKLGKNYISLTEAKRELDNRRYVANVLHDKFRKYEKMKKNNKIRHFAHQYYGNYDKKSPSKKRNRSKHPYHKTNENLHRISVGSSKTEPLIHGKPNATKFKEQFRQKTFNYPAKVKSQDQKDLKSNAKLNAINNNTNNNTRKTAKDNQTKLVPRKGMYAIQ